MHFHFDDVNHALAALTNIVDDQERNSYTTDRMSRNGPVRTFNEPTTITYHQPLKRVVVNPARDANPFFHVFESLWMLAGRNDVEPLKYFNSKIGDFSDDGETFNGAYGYRWCHAHIRPPIQETDEIGGINQLEVIINHLKNDHDTRRAVLNMWNVRDDLLRVDGQHGNFSKDVCCNLSVKFSIKYREVTTFEDLQPQLDMTVFNRSNDLLWGALGANYVHFTFLQEYVALMVGVRVGRYNQISDDLHVYTERKDWKPEQLGVRYPSLAGKRYHLMYDQDTFHRELNKFVDHPTALFEDLFLKEVASPMMTAFMWHKNRKYDKAYSYCEKIQQYDWYVVCKDWLRKREERYVNRVAKNAGN